MKHKMSITVEENLIFKIRQKMLENRLLRSKSQVIEEALYHYLDEGEHRA
ncbi:hypothetical protein HYS48_04990 [Candidatus Woesearchaeota archaeon]|nr:hypothetical protein [Candidatus Woesearchaeota archaeon]